MQPHHTLRDLTSRLTLLILLAWGQFILSWPWQYYGDESEALVPFPTILKQPDVPVDLDQLTTHLQPNSCSTGALCD